ncbi:MAG: hypothetical protein ACLFVY_10795 [Phycisphaerae bacterium]
MPQLTNQQRVEAMAGVGLFAAMDADQRRAWQDCRTSFNRFLLGNILILALSYLWLQGYVWV